MARILLVHGEELVRDHIAAALKCQGHDVTSASSENIIDDPLIGDTRVSRYDLIIADEVMRETASTETIQFFRSAFPDTKILAIARRGRTGVANDDLELAMAAGANATLSKPFSTADLFRTVDKALRAICPP